MAAAEQGYPNDGADAGDESQAEALKAQGNEHFKAQRPQQAANCYRKALDVLRNREASGAAVSALGQTVRINLATCMQRLGSDPVEAVKLCDEVLAAYPRNAKGLFRRAASRRDEANALQRNHPAHREALTLARRDLVEAAKIETSDRQIREKLEEVTEELRVLGTSGPSGQGGFSGGLRGGFARGLDDARSSVQAKPEPPPVEPCSVCERVDHETCGKEFWVQQRAQWLRMPVEEVEREPETFEEDGLLMLAVKCTRLEAAEALEDEAKAAVTSRYISDNLGEELPELSDEVMDMLEDCLLATDRPYPQPKGAIALAQAVRCAEAIWDDEGLYRKAGYRNRPGT